MIQTVISLECGSASIVNVGEEGFWFAYQGFRTFLPAGCGMVFAVGAEHAI